MQDMWGHLYHAITERWIHQNELMWSRLKVLLIIEGFILTSAYAIEHNSKAPNYLTIFLFIVGIIMASAIYIIILRDIRYRWMHRNDLISILEKGQPQYSILDNLEGSITGTWILKKLCLFLVIINVGFAFLWYVAFNADKTLLNFFTKVISNG